MSAADDLHRRVFGFTPAKAGTAYERLAAVVLAGLGWESVKHETKLRPEGRRAEQRLDVTATHPDGSIRRLLVECKDWNREVGKGTMDALVGVRDQGGFDAAMAVTTEGFTSGAVDVAVDEDIAMVILREHRPDDRFVMRIELSLYVYGTDWSDVQLLVAHDAELPDGAQQQGDMRADDRFLNLDGTPAETLAEVMQANSAPMQEGVFECEADFGDGRLAPTPDGGNVRATGMKWTETVSKSPTPQTSVVEKEGEPCLVLEQLDENGKADGARLVVDRDLYSWRIAEDGSVTEARELA